MNDVILTVENLSVRYGDYEAVKGVSFALKRGGILGIVGESGSGKSSIAKALMGLNPIAGGKVEIGHASASRQQADDNKNGSGGGLQMIFQDAVGSLNPRMKVGAAIAEALRHGGRAEERGFSRLFKRRNSKRGDFRAGDAEALRERTLALLKTVGLSEAVAEQYPRELSGGQCQRVSIARALATEPEILIADEPVSALDVSVQARVLNLLRDLRRDTGLSILLIAHDLAVVKNVCDDICVMERGVFVDAGPAETVFSHPQSEYTRRLLAAVPRL